MTDRTLRGLVALEAAHASKLCTSMGGFKFCWKMCFVICRELCFANGVTL